MKTRWLYLGLAALLLGGAAARADEGQKSLAGVSLGGRGAYYKPKDAANGAWSGGAQLRFHLTSVLALEGSADYRQQDIGGTTMDIYPVQASLLVYLAPEWQVSPYILGGGGWYFTHVHGGRTQNPFGPHAGAGLEWFLARHWSIDGSYRYIWNSDIDTPADLRHPSGQRFSEEGYVVTAGLNYRF